MKAAMWATIGVAVLVILGASVGGYALYQRHLTDDVKRLMMAALDVHASDTEVRQYTAQARPLERTRRDREVVGYLDDAITLFTSIQQDEQKDNEEFRETMRNAGNPQSEDDQCYGSFKKTIHLMDKYRAMGMKVPQDLSKLMQEEFTYGKDCSDRQKQESEARDKREKDDRKTALGDLNKVRVAIGLPIVPVK